MAHAPKKIVVLTEASKDIGARIARVLVAVASVVDAIRHCLAADIVRDFQHDFVRDERRLVSSGSKLTSARSTGKRRRYQHRLRRHQIHAS
jgi:hypothetical protein